MRSILYVLFVGALSLLPVVAFAQLVPCTKDCGFSDLVTMAHNIITFIITLAITISAGMFAFAGVLYFSDGGSKKNVDKAHKVFSSVVIGLVIVLVAWLIVDVILTNLTGSGLDTRAQNPIETQQK